MSNEDTTLVLMLDAPLQSWGFGSRFQRRTTAMHPTRSAVFGMICAALGADKGSDTEREWLARLGGMLLTIVALPRAHPFRAVPLPVLRLEDFHTILKTRSAEGKIKKDAVISHRQYLMDARFGILLAGDGDALAQIASALRDPVWGIWFGRKSCVPAAPVMRGIAPTRAEAWRLLNLTEEQAATLSRVEDAPSFEEGTDTIMDAPVSFLTREYAPRRITVDPGED